MTKFVYVVEGITGSYDCESEWNVCAYLTEEAAQAKVDKLHSLIKEFYPDFAPLTNIFHTPGPDWARLQKQSDELTAAMKAHPDGDPGFQFSDDTGTQYGYSVVELKGEL